MQDPRVGFAVDAMLGPRRHRSGDARSRPDAFQNRQIAGEVPVGEATQPTGTDLVLPAHWVIDTNVGTHLLLVDVPQLMRPDRSALLTAPHFLEHVNGLVQMGHD